MSALDQLFQDYHTASWMAAGLLLVMVEILLMPGFFLSYAIAAFLMALLSVFLDRTNLVGDIMRCLCGLFCKFFNFVGHYGKAAAGVPCASGLYSRVQC